MSEEIVETLLTVFTESETPFAVLVFLGFIFFAFMAFKLMKHSQEMNQKRDDLVIEQRNSFEKMFAEDRIRFDIRESKLLDNLKENTTQLQSIAETLKEVQLNYSSLEEKVTKNFSLIEYEIEYLKGKVDQKIEQKQNEEA